MLADCWKRKTQESGKHEGHPAFMHFSFHALFLAQLFFYINIFLNYIQHTRCHDIYLFIYLFSKFVTSIQHENIRKIVDILETGPSRSWALTLDRS